MAAVLSGFTVVWLIIAVGFVLGRLRVLGPEARVVLSRVAFFVASPCLLFLTISGSPIREVVGPQFAIAAMSAFVMLGVFLLVGRFLLPGRSGADLVIGGMSASLVNSANLGFPIAAYVLGDISLAAPIVMFQLALYTPIYVALLDQLTIGKDSTVRVRPRARTEVLRRVGQTLLNPMIIGCALGLLFSWQGWRLPEQIHEFVELLAGASIPLMLLAFGLSLVGSHPLDKASGRRRDVLIATGIKLLLHPGLAYLLAAFVFQLDGVMLLAAVVMASLPTAQNVLVAAVRYGTGEAIARDTVLVTTILGIPSMVAVALLLA
ncbi:AEC family transporter [Nesterenkonia alkaliphila]|uniref:AEC family transporter n=1 Tax=Nesterenkonia alkaliphila TaxID=1463631 RepID=A0A7K1UKN5_9MICC|nr:AEC family transporter [Nesterenkonia alkaliphila]MVT26986.1 AEC family transporter [Nesterenkonia alkaliphila]GFZ88218.1 permease [Nesterenkonia alkaliphila]